MNGRTIPIKESLKFGWETWKQNLGFLVGVFILSFLIPGLPSYVADSPRVSGPLSALLTIGSWILSLIISIGLVKITLAFVDGGKPTWNDLFTHSRYLARYFAASFLYALIVMLGLILLVIPGIYLGLKYQFAVYLIVDKNLGIFEAFKKSGEMTEGVKWPLFGWFIVQTLLNLAGVLALGIGLLVSAPVTMLAYAKIYRGLDHAQPLSV